MDVCVCVCVSRQILYYQCIIPSFLWLKAPFSYCVYLLLSLCESPHTEHAITACTNDKTSFCTSRLIGTFLSSQSIFLGYLDPYTILAYCWFLSKHLSQDGLDLHSLVPRLRMRLGFALGWVSTYSWIHVRYLGKYSGNKWIGLSVESIHSTVQEYLIWWV